MTRLDGLDGQPWRRHPPGVLRRILLSMGVLMGLSSCAAPSVTGEVTGEPVCPDFQLGGAADLMKGSLRNPIQISVVEDDDVRWQRIWRGKRKASDPPSKFVVEDDDDTYIIRWAQCPNTFAPKRVDAADSPASQLGSSYTCGEAKTYKEIELKVVEGDVSSRVIAWQIPPEPACWKATTAAAPDPSASAAAPDPSASADSRLDAGPDAAADAGPAASGAAVPSSSAAPSSSASAGASGKPGAGSAPPTQATAPKNSAAKPAPASPTAAP